MVAEKYVCPKCGKDPTDREGMLLSSKFISENNLILVGEYCNPGGRALIFKAPVGTIQLSDYCTWCDYETLKNKTLVRG